MPPVSEPAEQPGCSLPAVRWLSRPGASALPSAESEGGKAVEALPAEPATELQIEFESCATCEVGGGGIAVGEESGLLAADGRRGS